MSLIEVLQALLLLAGALFFLIGTIGLLRFPDVFTRIHALTKADNLGLGLTVFGLLPGVDGVWPALKLLLIWLLALIASAANGQLIAQAATQKGIEPLRTGDTRKPGA